MKNIVTENKVQPIQSFASLLRLCCGLDVPDSPSRHSDTSAANNGLCIYDLCASELLPLHPPGQLLPPRKTRRVPFDTPELSPLVRKESSARSEEAKSLPEIPSEDL